MVSWRLSETCARDNWIPKREPAGFGNSAWQSQISQRNQESQRQNVLDSKEKFCFRYLGVWVPNSRTPQMSKKKGFIQIIPVLEVRELLDFDWSTGPLSMAPQNEQQFQLVFPCSMFIHVLFVGWIISPTSKMWII